MAEKTITSANSVLTLVIAGLFNTPVQLKGYATDKAWATEAIDLAEVKMGVDGKMSAGYVPNPTVQTITLQADSDSKDIFATLIAATKTAREVYFLSATLVLPATGESFTMTRGVLTNAKQIPDGGKTLQEQDYVITWESIGRATL